MKFLFKVAAVSLATLSTAHAATIPGGRYGQVTLTKPVGEMRGFVVLFSEKAAGARPTSKPPMRSRRTARWSSAWIRSATLRA